MMKPRAVFIGRYSPFHKGHLEIMRKKIIAGVPLLVMIRDTDYDEYTPSERKEMIERALREEVADAEVIIIPDIESVNYGRGVGYEINEIPVNKETKSISATRIRELIKNNDESWRDYMPTGTHETILAKR